MNTDDFIPYFIGIILFALVVLFGISMERMYITRMECQAHQQSACVEKGAAECRALIEQVCR